MRIRLEGATCAELDAAEAAARRVFDVGSVSRDYQDREDRRRRRGGGTPAAAVGWRRYLEDVSVRSGPGELVMDRRGWVLFGYEQGCGRMPTPGQFTAAMEFLTSAGASGEPVAVKAVEIADEIVGMVGPVGCSMGALLVEVAGGEVREYVLGPGRRCPDDLLGVPGGERAGGRGAGA